MRCSWGMSRPHTWELPSSGSSYCCWRVGPCWRGLRWRVAGIVGFVGLVVPHVMRLLLGPDHRLLTPASFLGGGLVVIVAALVATMLGAVPLGIITSLLGAPFFLYLLHRQGKYRF